MIHAASAIAPIAPGQPAKGPSPVGGDLFALSMLAVETGEGVTTGAAITAIDNPGRQALAASGMAMPTLTAAAAAPAIDPALAWLPAVDIAVPAPLDIPPALANAAAQPAAAVSQPVLRRGVAVAALTAATVGPVSVRSTGDGLQRGAMDAMPPEVAVADAPSPAWVMRKPVTDGVRPPAAFAAPAADGDAAGPATCMRDDVTLEVAPAPGLATADGVDAPVVIGRPAADDAPQGTPAAPAKGPATAVGVDVLRRPATDGAQLGTSAVPANARQPEVAVPGTASPVWGMRRPVAESVRPPLAFAAPAPIGDAAGLVTAMRDDSTLEVAPAPGPATADLADVPVAIPRPAIDDVPPGTPAVPANTMQPKAVGRTPSPAEGARKPVGDDGRSLSRRSATVADVDIDGVSPVIVAPVIGIRDGVPSEVAPAPGAAIADGADAPVAIVRDDGPARATASRKAAVGTLAPSDIVGQPIADVVASDPAVTPSDDEPLNADKPVAFVQPDPTLAMAPPPVVVPVEQPAALARHVEQVATDTTPAAPRPLQSEAKAPAPTPSAEITPPMASPGEGPSPAFGATSIPTDRGAVPGQATRGDAPVSDHAAPARGRAAAMSAREPAAQIPNAPIDAGNTVPQSVAPAIMPAPVQYARSAVRTMPATGVPARGDSRVASKAPIAPLQAVPSAPVVDAAVPVVATGGAPAPAPADPATVAPVIAAVAPVGVADAPAVDTPVLTPANAVTTPAEPRPTFMREVSGTARQTVSLRPQAAIQPQPAAGTTASAGQVFGAAMHAAAGTDERKPTDPVDLPSVTPVVGSAPVRESAPIADAGQPTLDMRQGGWPAHMVDHIETLRDAANATDTRIRLIPDALGVIDIAVKTVGDAIHVRFTAEDTATRTMIEDAQPRLVEIAQERGLKIGQAIVEPASAGNQSNAGQSSSGQSGSSQSGSGQQSATGNGQQPASAQAQTGQQQPRQQAQQQATTTRRSATTAGTSSTDTDAAASGRIA